MEGAGVQSAGVTPAGVGDAATGTSYTGVMLQTETTGSYGARKINSKTKDYELSSTTGRILGMRTVQQMVLLAIANVQDRLGTIDRIGPDFEQRLRQVLTSALEVLIRQQIIEIVDISVRTGKPNRPNQAVAQLRWRDLTANTEQIEEI